MARMPPVQKAAHDWADDEEFDDPSALPPSETIIQPDGIKIIITYYINDYGKKVKTTRKIKTSIVQNHVNPRIAERREWVKFGKEKGNAKGPDTATTTIGENMLFKPSMNWKANQKEAEVTATEAVKPALKVACRICKGDHFTARCPYKDTMTPMDEIGATTAEDTGAPAEEVETAEGGAAGGSRYIAPHLRGKGGAGDKLDGPSGNYKDRDDLATLRVTNVSELAEEQDLRDMFERFGRVTRVFLAKDRETGRPKGFAFISYAERTDATRACQKMDGHGFGHLILRVEFATKRTN